MQTTFITYTIAWYFVHIILYTIFIRRKCIIGFYKKIDKLQNDGMLKNVDPYKIDIIKLYIGLTT